MNIYFSFLLSCVKKNFDDMCLILSPLIWPPYIWIMHAALSSYNIVELPLFVKILCSWICWTKDLNHTHSRLASWSASISAWFEKVVAIIYLVECQDVAVPPYVNKYPIWERHLCGSNKYSASTYSINCGLDCFEYNNSILVVPRR